MLNLQHRIDLLKELGKYILDREAGWQEACTKATLANAWFTPEFIHLAADNIARNFLDGDILTDISNRYQIPQQPEAPRTVGIVMAGNIPMVGFHDWLCVFLSGHYSLVKPSAKDNILIRHLVSKLYEWEVTLQNNTGFAEQLRNCDAYIATGSDNSARYFDYYFARYPHIIRRNRTSVAVLDGTETTGELDLLADDIHLYFGLGCRNVTKLYVPRGYNFVPLLEALKKYSHFIDHNKYKNNYDYQLAIHLLNNQFYMTNGSILLSETESLFSPISQLNYSFYENQGQLFAELNNNPSVQCVVGHGHTAFGQAQNPAFTDYADGIDTMAFLLTLS